MVIRVGALKDKKDREVIEDIRAVVDATRGCPVKVILETIPKGYPLSHLILLGFVLCCFVLGAYQAGLAKEVVLYSSNQAELIDMVSQGFEKKIGIKVSSVRMGTGEAMKRVQAEKDNPLGDLFWSGDVAVLDAAKKFFMP